MSVSSVTVTFDEADTAWARSLVEQGMYPSVEDAIRGELAETRFLRAEQQRLLMEEIKQRLTLPEDQFIRGDRGYFLRRFKEKHGLSDEFDRPYSDLSAFVRSQ